MQYRSCLLLLQALLFCTRASYAQPIDREAVVKRHNVIICKIDSLSSLTVGNGKFAYTVDATGMQSFPEYYANGVALGTQSEWGWHSFPNTNHYRFEETLQDFDIEGRHIPYPVQVKAPGRKKETVEYFRENPHRLQLGNIGLEIIKQDGTLATMHDIASIYQQLDLWTGIITSNFSVEGKKISIITVCHQQDDALAFKIESDLLIENRIAIRIRFPYPTNTFKDAGMSWHDDTLQWSYFSNDNKQGSIRRVIDSTEYYLQLNWNGTAHVKQIVPNYFLIIPDSKQPTYELACRFAARSMHGEAPSFAVVRSNSVAGWKKFWLSGGAIDFSGSTDKRAFELERRVVLSQYLTRVQEASNNPPQETGLTYNSWYGRPHLEMIWWHAVHYALWGRSELMEQMLDWYLKNAAKAGGIAKRQGFEGVRWQKMTDANGDEAPSSVGSFLIWQQPHFIYMADLLYRDKKDITVLNKYKDLVFATADFMASYPTFDPATKKYNLGKGLIPAQECFDPLSTFNPTYELAYWHWAIAVAQQWRVRLGMERNSKWDEIMNNLAPLPVKKHVYLATESTPDCYDPGSKYLTDHPAVLGAYASIPAANGLDSTIMKNTFNKVWDTWQWKETWGWDFPLTAMCAARLHMPAKAIDALFMPVQTNTYLINGHNYQDERLTIYLPGNGGLLSAVAMMCAGFDDNKINEPGIVKDGTWKIKWEGLRKIF